MNLLNKLAVALVISMSPFTDVLVFEGKHPVIIYSTYFIVVLVAVLNISSFFLKPQKLFNECKDCAYVISLIVITLCFFTSWMVNDDNERSIIYLAWLSWVFLIYGLVGLIVFRLMGDFLFIQKCIVVSMLIVCGLALQDWCVNNNFVSAFSLLDILGRGDENFKSELLGFIRLRGPTEEGAFFALYLVTYAPIALVNRKYDAVTIFLILIAGISYVLAMSLASMFSAILASLLSSILIIRSRHHLKLPIILILSYILIYIIFPNELLNRSIDDTDSSFLERKDVYSLAVSHILKTDIVHLLFGHGPAAFRENFGTNPLSALLLMLFDYGILGLAMYFILFYCVIRVLLASDKSRSDIFLLLFSVLSTFFHYTVISNIWFPWEWILFAIIFVYVSSPTSLKGRT